MRASVRRLPILLGAVALCAAALAGTARAQQPPHWETNLEAARRTAAQTNRLVLLHFWAPWCGPCKQLETNVFTQPGVAAAIEAKFVPVKVNVDESPATARIYQIDRYPTDAIIAPNGQLIYRLTCPQNPTQYVAQLTQAAASATAVLAAAAPPPQMAYAQAPPPAGLANPIRSSTPPGLDIYSSDNYQAYLNRTGVPPDAPAISGVPAPPTPPPNPNPIGPVVVTPTPGLAAGPPAAPHPRRQLPLGLDGYCPVTMVERFKVTPRDPHCWVPGNAQWGAVHRGMLYLFAGPAEQKKFLADPDRYSPVLAGADAVLALDRGQMQPGRREFGTFWQGRIFLFSNRETLEKFAQNPDRYAREALQAEAQSRPAMR